MHPSPALVRQGLHRILLETRSARACAVQTHFGPFSFVECFESLSLQNVMLCCAKALPCCDYAVLCRFARERRSAQACAIQTHFCPIPFVTIVVQTRCFASPRLCFATPSHALPRLVPTLPRPSLALPPPGSFLLRALPYSARKAISSNLCGVQPLSCPSCLKVFVVPFS